MKLTGKCKEDFEKWYKQTSKQNYINYGMFLNMPLVFQYGVYVDFFDSVGIFCEDRRYNTTKMAWVVKYPNFDGVQDRFDSLTKTRQEARVQAIEKANEIYNEL